MSRFTAVLHPNPGKFMLRLTREEIQNAPLVQPAILTIAADELPPAATEASVSTSSISQTLIKITTADLQPTTPQPVAPPELDALETYLFNLINAARQENLPRWLHTRTLKWHPGLSAVARGHSADMLKRQYVGHKTPEGKTAAQRLAGYGVYYLACGENIGVVYGRNQPEQAIQEIHHAFIKQPSRLNSHRGNLLNPLWTHVGVGVAYSTSGTLVVTQNFISTLG